MYFPLSNHYLIKDLEEYSSNDKTMKEKEKEEDLCIICLDKTDSKKSKEENSSEDEKNLLLCDCQFFIHPQCFNEWIILENNCPICKTSLNPEEKEKENSQQPTFFLITNVREIFITSYELEIRNFHTLVLYSFIKKMVLVFTFIVSFFLLFMLVFYYLSIFFLF
jgi:hypothetical protein